MPRRHRTHNAVTRIAQFFRAQDRHVFGRRQLLGLLQRHRDEWRLPRNVSGTGFIKMLLEQADMTQLELAFPSRKEIRYVWGDVPLLQVVSSLRPSGYFTHYSAVYLHGLTQQIPTSVYLNTEQSPKPRGTGLSQASIDLAFSRRPRTTRNKAVTGDFTIYLLNGMHTGRLGVVPAPLPEAAGCEVTNIERTLIDIAVRPWYSGGVAAVLDAYRAAASLASVNALVAMLRKLDYVYPYHQAIGFYLERSGRKETELMDLLREFPMEFDFYLVPQIAEKSYSERWRLFYPKGF